jgi:hypothetical protein
MTEVVVNHVQAGIDFATGKSLACYVVLSGAGLVGVYATEAEAHAAVEQAAIKALAAEPKSETPTR